MKKLTRTRSGDERIFFGVAGGIAKYFSIDPTIVRIICLYLFLLNFVAFTLAYFIAVFIVSEEPECQAANDEQEVVREDEQNTIVSLDKYEQALVESEFDGPGYDEEKLARVRAYITGDMTNQEQYEAVTVDIEEFMKDRYPQEAPVVGGGITYEGLNSMGRGVTYPYEPDVEQESTDDLVISQEEEEHNEDLSLPSEGEEMSSHVSIDEVDLGMVAIEDEDEDLLEASIDEEEEPLVTRFNREEEREIDEEEDDKETLSPKSNLTRTHHQPSYYRSRK